MHVHISGTAPLSRFVPKEYYEIFKRRIVVMYRLILQLKRIGMTPVVALLTVLVIFLVYSYTGANIRSGSLHLRLNLDKSLNLEEYKNYRHPSYSYNFNNKAKTAEVVTTKAEFYQGESDKLDQSAEFYDVISPAPEKDNFSYLSRETFYWNTLDLDFLHAEDFRLKLNVTSVDGQPLKIKIIQAEQKWKQYYETDKLEPPGVNLPPQEDIWNRFGPLFKCPHETESFGENKAICGFSLYTRDPKPEECFVLTFGTRSSKMEFETRWLSDTHCRVIMYQTEITEKNDNSQMELCPSERLAVNNSGSDRKQLRRIMQEQGIAWIDVLALEGIYGSSDNDDVYSILSQLLTDFTEILPFAQTVIDFPVTVPNANDKHERSARKLEGLVKLLKQLEERGLRPFHLEVFADKTTSKVTSGSFVARYSFLNIRGRHRLLTSTYVT